MKHRGRRRHNLPLPLAFGYERSAAKRRWNSDGGERALACPAVALAKAEAKPPCMAETNDHRTAERWQAGAISANEKRLFVFCNVLINPYGGRSLEELTFLWQKLSESEKDNANAKLRKRIKKEPAT